MRQSEPRPTEPDADAEQWLRSRGLPFFVAPRRRASLVVARSAPFLALLASADLAGWMLDRTAVTVDADSPAAGLALLAITGLALASLTIAPTVAFLVAGEALRASPRAMTVAGAVLSAFCVFIAPWLGRHPFAGADGVLDLVRATCPVGGALLATWLGAGSLLSWCLRSAVRQLRALGQLTSRALPLLMLVVVVSYFSRALWEVTNAMSAARLAGVVLFFVVLGLFFIVPVTRRETVGLDNPGPPLSRPEHANITTVLVLAQGLQVALFSLLVCAFLTALGEIAFSGGVLDAWLGADRRPVEVAGIRLPVDAAIVKTSVFLSCVSSLNFLVSAATTAAYRSAFYDPLFDDARRALAVRARYRSATGANPPGQIVADRE